MGKTGTDILREGRQFEVDARAVTTDQITIGTPTTPTSGALVLIESQSPSGASTVDFTTGIGSDYDRYVFSLTNVIPATDGVILRLRLSNDGGSNWISGMSDYRWTQDQNDDSGNNVSDGSTGDDKINITRPNSTIGSEGGEPGVSGTVEVYDPGDSSIYTVVQTNIATVSSGGRILRLDGGGVYTTAEAIDGVQFFYNSGNIEGGEIDLHGVMG